MKFGFFMMPAHSHNENPTLAFERDLQLIEYAESLGFDEFWVGGAPYRRMGNHSGAGHISIRRRYPHQAHTPGNRGDQPLLPPSF